MKQQKNGEAKAVFKNNHKKYNQKMGLINLTKNQMDDIHQATLDILEKVGVKVCEPEALKLLKDNGANVSGDLVKIPSLLVEQALQTVPSSLAIADRSGNRAMTLESQRGVYYGPGSDTPYIIDIDTGERRRAVKQDTINAARVCDALENIDFVMAMALASDMPQNRTDRHHFEAMVLNTTKPIVFDAHDRQGLLDIIAMAALIVGGKDKLTENPYIIHYAQPTSPLIHSRTALEKLLTAAAEKIPLIYIPAVMCGATAPVTTAGALVVANAESLSGLVIHQLKAEGAPFIYGGGTPPMDMITSVCSYGDPQRDLGCACLVQLSDYYNLPSFTTGGCSDAHIFDQQAAMEAGFNLLISGLSGGNMVHDLGYIGAGMTGSLEYLLLCNEGAGAVRFLTCGVDINPATLALEVIEKVGPGGHFLSEKHTMEHFRDEMHFTNLFNRNTYENWLAAGSKGFGENAKAMIKEILQWHEVPLLDAKIMKTVKDIAAGEANRHKLA